MADIREIWMFANNIIRSSRQMVNEELLPLGLNSAEGNILFHLLSQEKVVVQDEIVEQLDISKPAVSRALAALEAKGYIVRKKHPTDKRAKQVILTGQAQEISTQVIRVYEEVFNTAAAGISAQDAAEFIRLFEQVSERFNQALAAKKKTKEINS
jgi:DNA-binding MarR family transcriptional regulator